MASKVLVVGSGCIGLRTAIELLRVGHSVVLKSAYPPLSSYTCSMGAGGLWMPYKCDDPRIDKMSKQTLNELIALSKPSKNQPKPIVEIVPTLFLTSSRKGPSVDDFKNFDAKDYSSQGGSKHCNLPEWTQDSRLQFQHLSIDMLGWQNQVLKLKIPKIEVMKEAGYTYAWLFNPPIVDAPRMLTDMLNEVQAHPATVSVDVEMDSGYGSMDEMIVDAHKHGCDALVNCTGLGSNTICNDSSLLGGRGIVLHYERKHRATTTEDENIYDAAILTEEGNWGSYEDPAYLIPRGDTFVVGGAYHENNVESKLSHDERKRLMDNATLLGIDTSVERPINEWVGFRPVRPTLRMEIDDKLSSQSKLRVVHCYGHGGSGWTTYVGCAKEVAGLLSS